MTEVRTLGLRILLAVSLSFALWVFVSYTQNPDRRVRFDAVPVEVDGLAPGLVLVDNNGLPRTTRPTVSITVEAAADALQNVTERDVRAFQDVTDLGAGQHIVDVQVETNRTDRLRLQLTTDPFRLPLRIDQEISTTVALSVTVDGVVPFSFEALEANVTARGQTIQQALISGPSNRIERVVRVQATADIDRLTSTYNSPRTLDAIDADGKVVDGVIIDPPQVLVQIPIVSSVGLKRVPIVPAIIGEPASGYVVVGVAVEPQLVTLTGSSGPLDNVESVSTASVSVAGATRSFTQTVALQEPQQARLRFGEPTTAVVTVQIAALDRPFQVSLPVPVQAIEIEPGVVISLSPNAILFTLQGRSGTLGRLDTTSLIASVSLRGLGPGTYQITPQIQLPDGITLAAPPSQVTVTIRAIPTPTPPTTPTIAEDGTQTAVVPTPEPTPAPTSTPVP
jgi:YbbR domain-containing protein